MANLIDLQQLTEANVKYNPQIYQIVFMGLADFALAMRINVLQTKKDDAIKILRRRGNIMRPYKTDAARTIDLKNNRDFLKVDEFMLNLKRGYINLYDDISLYQDSESQAKVLVNSGKNVSGTQLADIPMKAIILMNAAKTIQEDIICSMAFGQRNEDGTSPLDCFDGFNTIITDRITAGDISIGKGNLVNSGSLAFALTGTTAYDNLLAWLRNAGPKMRLGYAVLRITNEVKNAVLQAYKNKVNNFSDPGWDTVAQRLKEDANFQNLEIVTHAAWGTGQRIILSGEYTDPTMRDLFDFGINYEPAESIFQVRAPFENPNLIQYFAQPRMGCRIKGFLPSVFMVNEGTNQAVSLSGDYTSDELNTAVNPNDSAAYSEPSAPVAPEE